MSAKRLRGARRFATAAAATLYLHLLQVPATAQSGAGDSPQEASQVLSCRVTASLPSPPATATEGGFSFQFESLGGTAVDGRACTVYRLRNSPGGPPTPVRWAAGSEVLVDSARLGRCQDEASCTWLEVARYFDGDFVGGDTVVSYGLNADSFSVRSPGLVSFSSPDVGSAAASVGTEVVGTLVSEDGEEVRVDLVVKSRFEREEGALVLVYEATADDPAQLDGSRFVLEWEALSLLDAAGDLPRSSASAPYDGGGLFSDPSGEGVLAARAAEGSVAIRVPATRAVYRDGLVLTVLEPGPDGGVLLRLLLPAFLPYHP